MKRLYKRLKVSAGETLVETMAAILIFTLSSIILLSMVSTATKLNATAKKADEAIASELNSAEAKDADMAGTAVADGKIYIYSGTETSVTEPQEVSVTRYSSGNGTLYSYSMS